MAKKRNASTHLLRRFHGYMHQHNVDFVGGDFNMSAFSTVGGVFSDPEFSAPGNSLLWGLGALQEENRECTGFLIMPHGCYKYDNAELGFGPRDQRAHLPSSISAPPTYLAPTASRAANKLSKDGLSAKSTDRRGRDDRRA